MIVDLAGWSRGRHVIHVKPTPCGNRPIAPKAAPRPVSISGEACEHFTFYFHAVLIPMYATSLTYSPDIAFWHVLPTESIFIFCENENLSTSLKWHRSPRSPDSKFISRVRCIIFSYKITFREKIILAMARSNFI